MEVASAPIPTKKALEEFRVIFGKEHAAVARYEGELERYERSLAGPKEDATEDQPAGKMDGNNPPTPIWPGFGSSLEGYGDSHPAEEIL
jgi:hypothetical protein